MAGILMFTSHFNSLVFILKLPLNPGITVQIKRASTIFSPCGTTVQDNFRN